MIKVIWSSNGELDDLLQMPADRKRLELTNWYDQEMVDQLADDEFDKIIGDNADAFYNEAMEDFEYRIAPMISNQFLGGFVLNENFNVVDPGVLLSDARETCEIYEDDNGDLYWKEEGRKAIPLLGFAEDQDKFIDQLDQLDILSTMHNLYPDQDDEDIEIYDIADLIPFDWTLLGNVLNHAVNNLDAVEEELTEAKAKNPNKLANELEEIKDLSEEYGREYFTQMPFTSYDNDPISIEMQYPEFFRVVKSFFKEMGILEGEDLNNPDVLDMSWDQDISQHDWDVLMRACEKLVNGKGVQFEKEYKTGYNSVLDDDEILASREQEESLNEDVDIDLSKVNSSDIEKAKAEVLKIQQLQKFKNDDSLDQALKLYAVLGNKYDTNPNMLNDLEKRFENNANRHEFLTFYQDFINAQKNKDIKVYDYDDERRDKTWAKMTISKDYLNKLKNDLTNESLNESVEIHMEGTYDMADLLDEYDKETGKVHDNLEFIKDLGKNKHLYRDDEGIEFIVTDEGIYDDLDESVVTDNGRKIASKNFGWIHKELFRLSDAVDQLNRRKSLKPDEKEAARAIIDVANDIHRDLIDENLNEDVRFYVDGGDVVDSLKDDRAIGTLYDDGTVELFDAKSVSKADRERIKKDLSNHYYVSFLDEDWINPELYKPFGHDSYDSGYVYEPRDPEEDEARILPPDADDEDWEDDLDEDISEYKDVYMLVDADGNDLYSVDTKEEAKEELEYNPDAVAVLHKRVDDSFRFEDPNFEPVPVNLDEDASDFVDVYMLVDKDGNELYGLETIEDAKEELKGNSEAVKVVHKRMDDSFRIEDPNWEDKVVIDTLNEDTVTWPWGDPNEELPQKKLPDKTSSDSLVNKLI